MSERVERELQNYKENYEVPADKEFLLKTILKLQEEYDSIEKSSHTTKTRDTLLNTIANLQLKLNLKEKENLNFKNKNNNINNKNNDSPNQWGIQKVFDVSVFDYNTGEIKAELNNLKESILTQETKTLKLSLFSRFINIITGKSSKKTISIKNTKLFCKSVIYNNEMLALQTQSDPTPLRIVAKTLLRDFRTCIDHEAEIILTKAHIVQNFDIKTIYNGSTSIHNIEFESDSGFEIILQNEENSNIKFIEIMRELVKQGTK